MEAWTDARLDDLLETLRPLPTEVARQAAAIEGLTEETRSNRLEIVALRGEFAASQQQLAQIGWGLVFALIAAVTAVIVAAVL